MSRERPRRVIGPATAWARSQQPGSALRWKELEMAAWSGHPTVARALAGRLSLAMALVAAGTLITYVVAFAYPIVALAASTPGRGATPWAGAHTRLSTAGVVVAVGFVAHTTLVGLWVLHRSPHGRLERSPVLVRQAWVVLVAGLLLLVAVIGLRSDAAGGAWVLVMVGCSIVLSAATLVLHRTAATPDPDSQPTGEPTPRASVRRAVDRVPASELDAVRADLERSLDDLAERGVISGRELEKVRGAPLGMLTIALSAPPTRS